MQNAKALYLKFNFCILFLFFCMEPAAQELNYLFKQGESGYKCFRIPAIVLTNNGTLLALLKQEKQLQ